MSGKDMRDYIPILEDQGIPNLVGAYARGLSVQYFQAAMPSDGVITFASVGASDMASASYGIFVHNHTGAVQGTVVGTATGITVTGPTEDDVLDVLIIGKLKGQQS
jgi:hypothetical protein